MRSALSLRRPVRNLDALATLIAGPSPSAKPATSPVFAAALLGLLCGGTLALAGLNGLYLCLSLIGAGIILYDFRTGVVLLILLMPISRSSVFPHEMLGITGLNPLNLLLVATLGSYLLQALFDGSLRRFLPAPLVWLYVVPIIVAGVLGARHVNEIVSTFYTFELISFNDPVGYLRDMVAKPLLMVVFALLVGAAVEHSERPERFLLPAFASVWIMGLLVIVFVLLSGASLSRLASASAREFLTPLGLHANDLGRLYTVAYALLLFTWGYSTSRPARFAMLASMAMVAVALLLTFSRAAFAGIVVVNGLYLLWRRNTRALTYTVLLAAIVPLAVPNAVYERITKGFGQGLDAITAGRLENLWIPLFPEVWQSPLVGSGIASILWSDTMQQGIGVTVIGATHPHNAYLEALLDMGLVGLALLGLYFVHVWRRLGALHADPGVSPALRGYFQGAAAGLLAFLLAAMAGGSLLPRPEQALLWLAIGMMYGQTARRASA